MVTVVDLLKASTEYVKFDLVGLGFKRLTLSVRENGFREPAESYFGVILGVSMTISL
jgi:hypothetical protein